ncbi:MAG: hypothetical protein HOL48_06925 [Porticoccaceae bacterium]|nr:hypothetical protein [Porticoccaceae bacterium]
MSYVLDALKKAERERHHQPELGMDNLEQDDWVKPLEPKNKPRLNKLLWVTGISLCLLVSLVTVKFSVPPQDSQELLEPLIAEQSVLQNAVPDTQTNSDEESELVSHETLVTESVQDLSLAELLQEFRFEGSLYIEGDPQASRVFIDGQAYFVGQILRNDVYIKDITLDSVIISNGYEEAARILR